MLSVSGDNARGTPLRHRRRFWRKQFGVDFVLVRLQEILESNTVVLIILRQQNYRSERVPEAQAKVILCVVE